MAWPEHRLNNKATTASPISLGASIKIHRQLDIYEQKTTKNKETTDTN